MRPRQIRRAAAFASAAVVLAGSAIGYAAKSQAGGVCDYLDTHPGVAGVEDLVAASHYGLPDSTDYQHGQAIAAIVVGECPRHLFALDEFVAKYSQPQGFVA